MKKQLHNSCFLLFLAAIPLSASAQFSISSGVDCRFEGHTSTTEKSSKVLYNFEGSYEYNKWRITLGTGYLPIKYHSKEYLQEHYSNSAIWGYYSYNDYYTYNFDVKIDYLTGKIKAERIFESKKYPFWSSSLGLFGEFNFLINEKESNHKMDHLYVYSVQSNTPNIPSGNDSTLYATDYSTFDGITPSPFLAFIGINKGERFHINNFFIELNLAAGLFNTFRSLNNLYDPYSDIEKYNGIRFFYSDYYMFFQANLSVGYTFNYKKSK